MTKTLAAAIALLSAGVLPAADWTVPAADAAIVSPLATSDAAVSAGKATYTQFCLICHGTKGRGDGDGAAAINPKPASLADPQIAGQSDGALYWKITTGRNAMLGWKAILSDQQRWEVVQYLRVLTPPPAAK